MFILPFLCDQLLSLTTEPVREETKGGEKVERMTVQEAAEYLGITPQLLRMLMDKGELRIGKVVRNKRRNTYLIYRELIEEGVKS